MNDLKAALKEATEAIVKLGWSGIPSAELADTALEAAYPLIAAQALEDLANALEDLPMNSGAEIKPWTWEYFELFPVMHIRERAAEWRNVAGL